MRKSLWRLIAPRIGFSLDAASRGTFPFSFGRKAVTISRNGREPLAIASRVEPTWPGHWLFGMIEIRVVPVLGFAVARRAQKMRVLRVRQLTYGQFERVNPNAMHGPLIILSGFAPHQEPAFGDPDHARLAKFTQRKISVMDRRCHWKLFRDCPVMLSTHCRSRVRVGLRLTVEIYEEPVCAR